MQSTSTKAYLIGHRPTEPLKLCGSFSARLLESNHDLRRQLARANQHIELLTVQMRLRESEARTDRLTSLLNRRAFDEELARQFAIWNRYKTPFVLLLLDVDHFKRFNDLYGHQIGDNVLRAVAQSIVSELRGMDLAYRYGGEEFAAVLPATTGLNACLIAERVRGAVASKLISGLKDPLIATISIGIANVIAGDGPAQIICRADEALYQSKQAGRNCARWHDGDAVHSTDVKVPFASKDSPAVPAVA